KITEILEEVDNWTGFTRHFTHLKNNNIRPKDGRLMLLRERFLCIGWVKSGTGGWIIRVTGLVG
ncbi:hypothetical protein A3370_26960, partial [Escherichia coli]|nr:hypothetical protein [Escherichia coli]EFP9424379.1 transposase [Shigella dysenteriae]EFX8385811.1 hypothetical protein [Shigella dysenteriae]